MEYAIYAEDGGAMLWLGDAGSPRAALEAYAQGIGYETWVKACEITDTTGTLVRLADATDRETWMAL